MHWQKWFFVLLGISCILSLPVINEIASFMLFVPIFAPTCTYYLLSAVPAVILSYMGVRIVLVVVAGSFGLTIAGISPHVVATLITNQQIEDEKKMEINVPLAAKPRSIGLESGVPADYLALDEKKILTWASCRELCQKLVYGRSLDWVGFSALPIGQKNPNYGSVVTYHYFEQWPCPSFLSSNGSVPVFPTLTNLADGKCILPMFKGGEVPDVRFETRRENIAAPFHFVPQGDRTWFHLYAIKDGMWIDVVRRARSEYYIPTYFPLLITFGMSMSSKQGFSTRILVVSDLTEESFLSEMAHVASVKTENEPPADIASIVGKFLDEPGTEVAGAEQNAALDDYLRSVFRDNSWNKKNKELLMRVIYDARFQDDNLLNFALMQNSDLWAAALPAIVTRLEFAAANGLPPPQLGYTLGRMPADQLEQVSLRLAVAASKFPSTKQGPILVALSKINLDDGDLQVAVSNIQRENLLDSNPQDENVIEKTIEGLCKGPRGMAVKVKDEIGKFTSMQHQRGTVRNEYIVLADEMHSRLTDTDNAQITLSTKSNETKAPLNPKRFNDPDQLRCLASDGWK
ncbi:MAG: hypothetical protein ABI230_10450 [Aestuariivirga sp.]